MADAGTFVGNAGGAIDAGKANALAAIAATGSQGMAQTQATAASLDAQKTQALKDAISLAATHGANTAPMQGVVSDRVALPYTTNTDFVKNIGANYAADSKASGQAFGQYADTAKAGLGVANDVLNGKIATAQSKAADAQYTRDARMQALADKQAKLADPNSTLADYIRNNGGAQMAGNKLQASQDQYNQQEAAYQAQQNAAANNDNRAETARGASSAAKAYVNPLANQGLADPGSTNQTQAMFDAKFGAGAYQSVIDQATAKNAIQKSAYTKAVAPQTAAAITGTLAYHEAIPTAVGIVRQLMAPGAATQKDASGNAPMAKYFVGPNGKVNPAGTFDGAKAIQDQLGVSADEAQLLWAEAQSQITARPTNTFVGTAATPGG